MFYLFILESIGTSELLMIGLVALIVFGPRKLPEMMRTIGKAVAEFRRSTDDFKRTWEKEANFGDNEFNTNSNSNILPENQIEGENSVPRSSLNNNKIAAPKIREVSRNDFSIDIPNLEIPVVEKVSVKSIHTDKQDWL